MRRNDLLMAWSAAVLAVTTLGAAGPARAEVWYVTPGGSGDGTSWATAFGHPQTAVDAASAGDEVWVAAGTYTSGTTDPVLTMKDGVSLYGGFAGNESFRDERDPAANETILDGEDVSDHVLVAASQATLDGFTLRAGAACGLYCSWGADALLVADCRFLDNGALGWGGGAYLGGCTATLQDCVFSGNVSASSGGGLSASGGALTVKRCVFTGNTASTGAGAYCYDTVFVNCVFAGNTATSSCGGASLRDCEVRNCVFWGNSAATVGGLRLSGRCSLSNSVVRANAAGQYAGVQVSGESPVEVLRNCLQSAEPAGGNFAADPLFVDPGAGDFHLQPGSPCIDFADGDLAPATDFDGNVRHDDPGMPNTGAGAVAFADIGAFEFQGETTGSWVEVFTPAAGDALAVGASVTVTWSTSADVGSVKIELSRDGGAGWEVLAFSTPNDRSFEWTITDGGPALPQKQCLARVSDAADGDPTFTTGEFVIFPGVWYVDSTAAAGGDGLSWATAFRHPQEAADAASAGHEVWVAAGTYTSGTTDPVLVMAHGVAFYGGFAGGETSRDGRDPAANETILDGENLSYHVAFGASGATLDGFKVTRGNATGGTHGPHGGGLWCDSLRDLSVSNCAFVGNHADSAGGGVFARSCILEVTDCLFDGNTAYGGGGLWMRPGTVTMLGCTFMANQADLHGGAAYLESTSATRIEDCTFENNVALQNGGGVAIWGPSPDFVFARCRFVGNQATGVSGGLDVFNYADGRIENCVFAGNTAGTFGGGFHCDLASPAIVNCTVYGNSAAEGGGVELMGRAYPDIVNCIVWGNSAPSSPGMVVRPDANPSVTYSCLQESLTGEGNFVADPVFVDAASGDFRLSPGSPCIDAADGSFAPGFDFDGNPRHDDPGAANGGAGTLDYADIGAHEFQGTSTGKWLDLLSPAAGEEWRKDSEAWIVWSASSDVAAVKIELSRDGGGTWEMLASSAPNTRSFSWTVTDGGQALPQAGCVIRVSDAAGPALSDVSDTFTVVGYSVWYVDAGAPAAGDGSSWATAFQRPQEAVDAASAGDEVWVAAGTYTSGTTDPVVTMERGVSVYGGFAGDEPEREARDPGVNETVLDGEGLCYHVVRAASVVRLSGFTVTGGQAVGASGGGVYALQEHSLELDRCRFTGNSAERGGAVDLRFSAATIDRCMFDGNDATYGGGLCAEGAYGEVANCTFRGNTAQTYGGAARAWGDLRIANCTVLDNSAGAAGGGISCVSGVLVANTIAWGNSAPEDTNLGSTASGFLGVRYSCIQGGYAGEGNIDSDPLFVDSGSGDFHLQAGSPCIDAADGDVAPQTDTNGNTRHDDPGTPNTGTGAVTYADMGAYEFHGDSRGEAVTPFDGGCGGAPSSSGAARAGIAAMLAFAAAALRGFARKQR